MTGKVLKFKMISYKIDELQIFKLKNITINKIFLKSSKIENITENLVDKLNIYSSDQLHIVVSKIAVLMQVGMSQLSCVFSQDDNYQTPYSYQLNRVSFDNQSILNVTLKYKPQQQLKEIGPIPFFINELEFIDRFQDDETSLIPKVFIRPYTIGELFDPLKNINIYILPYSSVEMELRKYQLVIKSPQYLRYFKYLFEYKYFPCLQDGQLIIDTQYQLKFNEIQKELINPETQHPLNNIVFSHLTDTILIQYQLNQLEVDLILIFDSIKMKDHPKITYIQYLYIQDESQFYIQKAHTDQLYSYNQFYENILVFSMKSGLKCKINQQGLILCEFKIPIGQIELEQNVEVIHKQKQIVEGLFNDFLILLNQISQQFTNDSFISTQSNEIKQSSGKTLGSNQLKKHQYQAEFNMISKIQVSGLYVSDEMLKQVVQENKELFKLKGTSERQISTQIFMNTESVIELLEGSEQLCLFELQSPCTPLAKIIIPALMIYVLKIKGVQQNQEKYREYQGNARLITTDPYLYKQLKENEQYGRLCKKTQQPIPVDKMEEGQQVYEYYNFTNNKPQLYKCPSNAPYMGFIVGKHQKDFCLPCCYTSRQDKSQKKSEVTKTCFVDHKYSKDSQKQSDINTYIFTNPSKLQINRNTILHPEIQKFISADLNDQMAWFIFTLKIPEYTVNQSDRIQSLIESCCYLLNVKKQDFIDKLKLQMTLTAYSQSQFTYFLNQSDQLLNMTHFEFIISQVVESRFACNLIMLRDIQEQIGVAEVNCFGISQEKSILVQKKKHIYNPIILGQCESTRKINNTDHISSKFMQIPNEYITKLKSKFENQRDQRPHSVLKVIQKLKQSQDIHSIQFQKQIINQQGFVYFIEVEFRYQKGASCLYLLPVQSSLPISSNDMKVDTKFSITDGYNKDNQGLLFIIETIYKCTPNSRIMDSNGDIKGVLFNNLFFYSESNKIFENLPINQNIKFNPILLNQSIIEGKFKTLNSQTVDASLRFIYFSNVYRLMRMQYTYFLNNENKVLSDWTQIFSFCSMDEILQRIEKLARQKRQYGLQELVKLKACMIADEPQFFCEKKKLLVPNEFKPYVELMKRDIARDANIRINQLYQIMLQEFVFQDREGDHLQQGQIE